MKPSLIYTGPMSVAIGFLDILSKDILTYSQRELGHNPLLPDRNSHDVAIIMSVSFNFKFPLCVFLTITEFKGII